LVSPSLKVDTKILTTEQYTELTAALDLTVNIYNLRLQAEGFRAPRIYGDHRPKPIYAIINIPDARDVYVSDSVSWYSYALAAYKIPVQLFNQETEFTPYVLYEFDKENFFYPKAKLKGIRGGLNFKPSPFVAIKYESTYERTDISEIKASSPAMVSKFWVHAGQVAISF
jgi:hypothetical protein